jgi:hypothetical protein
MMAFFLIVLAVPLLVAVASFVFLDGVSWKEFGLQVLASLVVAGSSAGIVSCANTHDVEVWNGRVAKKWHEHVSCEHSYTCNCRSESCGKNCSTTVCDTCYEHSYDVSWRLSTSNGEQLEIDRVSRQGLVEPPRWTTTKVGEPSSVTHSYDNYVKAAPDTLFRHQGLKQKYAASLPAYPQDVYDYYRINRLVTVGVNVPEGAAAWNTALSEANADLGAPRQANIIVVLVKDKPDDWYYALEESWIGGKKNDVILVVSVDDAMKPQWATVMCWTTNELFKVKLRDDVMNDAVLTRDAVVADLRTNVSQYFVRKPMKDFKYLAASIVPSKVEWIVTLVVGLLIAGGLTWLFETQDVFGDRGYNPRRNPFTPLRSGSRRPGKQSDWSPLRAVNRLFNRRPWEDV